MRYTWWPTVPFELPALFQAAPVAVASVDLDGCIRDVNRALLDLSGYSATDIVGLSFAKLIGGDAADALASFAELVSGRRESYRAERRYRRADGDVRDVRLAVSLVRGEAGQPVMCLAVAEDVTEHRRAVEESHRARMALQLSEARYRSLVDQAPLSIQILSPDGRTLHVNAAWERLWGLTLDQVADYNVLEDPQLVERGLAPFIRKAFDGEPALIPAALYDPDRPLRDRSVHDDSGRWVRAVIYPLKDAEGRISEVVLIHEDITDQVRADEQRREATELLTLVVQQSGEAIIVTDASGVLRVFNPAAEQLHGVRADATPSREWTERYGLLRTDGTELPYNETALYRALVGESVHEAQWLVKRSDGSIRRLVGSAAPLRRSDGTPAGAVLIARDETARFAYEEQRERLLIEAQRAHREIEAASRMKDEFLATLSHELRTPLNAILGWTRILSRSVLDPSTTHALDVIHRNAVAQARLVDDLLDVSSIMSGKIRLNLESVDLGVVAAAAVETVRPAADAKGLQIVFELDPELPPIAGDMERLQQVFWNLLSNAVKFTQRGGRILLRLSRDGGTADIVLRDTGIGIDRDMLPHVFDRFTQADSSTTRPHAGLGLGLAIVRHLVESHGGSVSAESDGLGKGSLFRIRLPLPSAS